MSRGLELLIAQTILQGFDAQYGRFLEVTSGAQQRFEHADWHAVQQAMKQRIHLYDHHVGLVVEQLRCITDGKSPDAEFLLRVKEHYTHLLPDYPRFEIAESFFNSVYCRLFDHRSLSPERLFIFSSQPERRFRTIPRPLAKDFFPDRGWEKLLHRVLTDLPLRLPWQNKPRDIGYIHAYLSETFGEAVLSRSHLQVANELFYRNKAAWLVGKLVTPTAIVPFLLPIHRTDDGELFVDTCLTTSAGGEYRIWLRTLLFHGLRPAARRPGGVAARDPAGQNHRRAVYGDWLSEACQNGELSGIPALCHHG